MIRRLEQPRLAVLPVALVVAFAALAAAGPAMGARSYEAEIMDDQIFLDSRKTDAQLNSTMALAARLGADTIKVSAFWRDIAPGRSSRTRPKRFDPTDHRSRYRWSLLDRVIVLARTHGMKVSLSVTGPGPLWASANPRKGRLWKPRVSHFADFAQAVAARYKGSIARYALWNEPNQGAWLQPQHECRRTRGGRRSCRAFAPHHYRQLVRHAYPRIKATDPGVPVLMGELAPTGRNDRGATRPIRPLKFLKLMGCRSPRYGRIRGGACKGFRPARADAIGHHPYSVFIGPAGRSPSRDDAALGDTSRLISVLDRLRRGKALLSANGRPFQVYYTEYGYQTNPPDPFSGIPLGLQSRWLQDAAYRVWRHPRLRSLNQFRLTDGPILKVRGPKKYLEFQSGLLFAGGKRKPSYATYPDPFRANKRRVRRRGRVSFWGQVRPGDKHLVEVLKRSGGRWRRHTVVLTDRFGAFTFRDKPSRTTRYRYRYADPTARGSSDILTIRVR